MSELLEIKAGQSATMFPTLTEIKSDQEWIDEMCELLKLIFGNSVWSPRVIKWELLADEASSFDVRCSYPLLKPLIEQSRGHIVFVRNISNKRTLITLARSVISSQLYRTIGSPLLKPPASMKDNLDQRSDLYSVPTLFDVTTADAFIVTYFPYRIIRVPRPPECDQLVGCWALK